MSIGSIGGSAGYGNTIADMLRLAGMNNQNSPPSLATKKLADLDTDGDGSISQAEFEKALTGTTGTASDPASDASSSTTALADSLFKKIDANGDGKISTDEWSTFQQKIQAGGHHHHHHAHASSSDDDSQSATQTLQNIVAQLYKSADTNGDGQLSPSEMTNWLS